MADQNKEWYTIQELVELFGSTYAKVRSAVFNFKNTGDITARDNPRDARIVEIHRDSIQKIKQAVGA
ncbi:MAG: hypothetical protein H0X24_01890 [Ktedonobacterales bacterium]|nr:hypothetical protein [Ktedonobacterales bacterium]